MEITDGFLGLPLLQCSGCGHIQLSSLPDQSTLAGYYTGQYSKSRRLFVNNIYLRLMENRAAAQLAFIRLQLPGYGGLLMDIGCGYGALLRAASQAGFSTLGIEFDPVAVDACRKAGLDVQVAQDELQLAERIRSSGPDVVTMSHSLEHLREPAELLAACAACIVMIEVPAYTWTLPEMFDDQEGHLNFFTRTSLEHLVRRLGFEVLTIGEYGPDMQLFWPRSSRWKRRLKRWITGDYFFNKYNTTQHGGIWVRALIKGPACRS